MADYTQLPIEDAKRIVDLYDLASFQKIVPLSLGISNSNYRLETASEVLLLKVSNDKNIEQLTKEQEILTYLKNLHYTYSLSPLNLSDGQVIYHYKKYFGVIYPFIEGIPPGPSDQTCADIGKGLAELHLLKHAGADYSKIRSHEEVGFSARKILEYSRDTRCPVDFKENFDLIFVDRIEEYLATSFAEGVIHGDLYYDNTLFQNNHLSVILDFEQAGRGELLLDLGICISGACLEKSRISLPLIKSLLEGYESLRPLPEIEKRYLNTSILLGLFSIALWRIKRFTEGDLNPLMKESYKDLIYKAIHFNESLQS